MDHQSDKMPDRTKYEFYISISYEGGRYLPGGVWYIDGAKATEKYEYQIARRYAATGVTEMKRSKFNGAWGSFV